MNTPGPNNARRCDRTQQLRQLLTEQPEQLQSSDWQSHFQTCVRCENERRSLEKSLKVFQAVEQAINQKVGNLDHWEQIKHKLAPYQKQPRLWRRLRIPLAVAAWVTLVVLSYQTLQEYQTPPQTNQLFQSLSIRELKSGEPFATQNNNNQFIWTESHFGIELKNRDNSLPAISIGLNLPMNSAFLQPGKLEPQSSLADR